MAQTASTMLPLGTIAPDFYLKDTNSNNISSFEDLKGNKGTLVMFICNHCPFVHHVIDEVVMIANDYRVQGIGIIAISSNDVVKYPQDAPELMVEFALENRIDFPYLYDEVRKQPNLIKLPVLLISIYLTIKTVYFTAVSWTILDPATELPLAEPI